MMAYPQGPRVLKGAIVSIDPLNPIASVIVFQYNPETLTRTLTPQVEGGEEGNRSESVRYSGAPVEEITLDLEIDATDQLAQGDPTTLMMGIYPQLSALEIIAYPSLTTVAANTVLLAAGTIEIVPSTAPLTLFIWGLKRVLPVRLLRYSIVEEAYDGNLNPIRARVSTSLRVLSYSDLPLTAPGYSLSIANQTVKQTMAAIGSVGNATAAIGVNASSLG